MEPKFHYRVHRSSPLVPILRDISSPHPSTLSSILILILSSHLHLVFRVVSSTDVFWPKFFTHFLLLSCVLHVRPFHPPDTIRWNVQVTKLLIMQSSPASPTCTLLDPNILRKLLLSNIKTYLMKIIFDSMKIVWLRKRTNSGSCEHGNEPSVSMKGGEMSWLAEWLLASQEGLSSMELSSEAERASQIN
jgi:hypothetical protein